MKLSGRKYTHGRNLDEAGSIVVKKRGLFPRFLGAAWVVVQFPFRWILYEMVFWFELLISRLGGARYVVVTARRGTAGGRNVPIF